MSETTISGADKIAAYRWTMNDEPGDQAYVSKYDLQIDHENYQRECAESADKVLAIAREWSWIACGSLIVARRGGRGKSPELFIVDGQTRWTAAMKRSDIKDLPCVVFDVASIKDEANGFTRANTNRKPVTAIAKFRAMVTGGDEIAEECNSILRRAGLTVASAPSYGNFCCISTMLRLIKHDRVTFYKVWPLCLKISDGERSPVHNYILNALFNIERRISPDDSLTARRWSERIEAIGQSSLVAAAQRGALLLDRGGVRAWSIGVVEALNKGMRKKLSPYGEA